MGALAEEVVRVRADTQGVHQEVESAFAGVGKKAAALFAGAFVGAKVGGFLKDAVKDAAADETAITRVGVAVKNAGESWAKLKGPVNDAQTSMSKASGFMKSELVTSFGTLERMTGNHTKALKLEKDAMNISAQTGKPLATVTLALGKAYLGSTGALGRLGIITTKSTAHTDALKKKWAEFVADHKGKISPALKQHEKDLEAAAKAADKSSTVTTALDKVHKTFAGGVEARSKTMAGQLLIFSAKWEQIKVSVGEVVLPLIIKVLGYASQGLDVLSKAFERAKPSIDAVVARFKEFGALLAEHEGVLKAVAVAVLAGAAAFVVWRTAVAAWAVVTRVATAVQLAFNLVMDANPIMLVVIAVAVLVGSMVLLYQRSETARAVIDAAFAGIKAAVQGALNYITNTVIPAALQAWDRFGPGILAALTTAIAILRGAVATIQSVITALVGWVRDHWDAIWSVIGPIVKAQFEVVKTVIQTTLNVVADIIRAFSDILHGRWGAAWGELTNLARDALNGVVSIVGSILHGLAGSAGAAAALIATAIWNGIKTVGGKLAALAGIIGGAVKGAVSTAIGSAFTFARSVGFAIADGVLSGVGNLAIRLKDALVHAVTAPVRWAKAAVGAASPSKLYAKEVGEPIGLGITMGVMTSTEKLGPMLGDKLKVIAASVAGAAKKEQPGIIKAFADWATNAKAAFDSHADGIVKAVDTQMAAAKARVDAWKAKLVPAEIQIAKNQAAAAFAAVQNAVTASQGLLDGLQAKQDATWSKLIADQQANMGKLINDQNASMAKMIADQQANMARLRATQADVATDSALAGFEYTRTRSQSGNDPIADLLIASQAHLALSKAAYKTGAATQAELFAAQGAFDDATLAAANDQYAQKLLADYNTWQGLLAQQKAGQDSINAQESADWDAQVTASQANAAAVINQQNTDAAAQLAAQTTFHDEWTTARKAHEDALAALSDYNLAQEAIRQRAAHDAQAVALNAALVARYDRWLLHFTSVRKATDAHFDHLGNMAKNAGKTIGEQLAQAMVDSIPLVSNAASALAQTVARYLKARSPTEEGPMSDLDKWWTALAPTLVASLDTGRIKAALTDATTPDSAARAGVALPVVPKTIMLDEDVSQNLAKLVAVLEAQRPAATSVIVNPVGVDASAYSSRR